MGEHVLPGTIIKQEYSMKFKICSLHVAQDFDQFCVSVNGVAVGEGKIGYTVGEWKYTDGISLSVGGDDVIQVTRKSEQGEFYGVTVKEIQLLVRERKEGQRVFGRIRPTRSSHLYD